MLYFILTQANPTAWVEGQKVKAPFRAYCLHEFRRFFICLPVKDHFITQSSCFSFISRLHFFSPNGCACFGLFLYFRFCSFSNPSLHVSLPYWFNYQGFVMHFNIWSSHFLLIKLLFFRFGGKALILVTSLSSLDLIFMSVICRVLPSLPLVPILFSSSLVKLSFKLNLVIRWRGVAWVEWGWWGTESIAMETHVWKKGLKTPDSCT